MPNDQRIFNHYKHVAKMLAEMFSPYLEIILHDLRDPEHSIIAIYNGHITGRSVGDATSDIGLKRISGEVPDDFFNYKNESPSGDPLRSSSIAIRNEKNKLIGAFSLNMNIAPFENIKMLLNQITETQVLPFATAPEKFHQVGIRDQISKAIADTMFQFQLNNKALSRQDKAQIVEELFRQGIFNQRGAVNIVADLLKVTRPTIYKYLKKVNPYSQQ